MYSFKKHPVKFLKTVFSDFNHIDVISEAKERLLNDCEKLKIDKDKWSLPPARRGGNRAKHDLDDILHTLNMLDENGLLSNLPKYAVDNLDNVPLIRMERGEFAVLVTKLDKLSDELNNLPALALSAGHYSRMANDERPAPNDLHVRLNARHSMSDSEGQTSDTGGVFEEQRSKSSKKRRLRTSPVTPERLVSLTQKKISLLQNYR